MVADSPATPPVPPPAELAAEAPSYDGAVPVHVAIIMDGNGRWARSRGLGRKAGHEAGSENIRRVVRHCAERGVQYLTLYAFSTENWGRPKQEVSWLMHIIGRAIKRETRALHANDIRVLHLGRLDVLSRSLQKQVHAAEELTANNRRMTVCVAFNYGGRAEIVDAVRRIVAEGIPPDQIDEAAVANRLYTAGLPDPDLVIRTAGELRLSNFLLWQSAYAELYATETYWPDVDAGELDRAFAVFTQRQRRFGRLPEPES